MGFFKKLKKGVRKLAKVAKTVAPIAAEFAPGGSTIGKVISRVSVARQKLGGVRRFVETAQTIAGDKRNLLRSRGLAHRLTGRRRGAVPPSNARQQVARRGAVRRKLRGYPVGREFSIGRVRTSTGFRKRAGGRRRLTATPTRGRKVGRKFARRLRRGRKGRDQFGRFRKAA